jgi:hypothetical protein
VIEITSISDYIKENNLESGILINAFVSFLLYIATWYVYPGIILYGDLQLLIGAIIGVRITIKYKNPDQSILKYGIITGIIGGVFGSILIATYIWILFSIGVGFSILILFWNILLFLFSGIAIGLLGGAALSAYYMYKEVKGERIRKDTDLDEAFFKDLIEEK